MGEDKQDMASKIKAMRDAVMKQAGKEADASPRIEDLPTLTHDFVRQCAQALEKGAGKMLATLLHGRFVYVPEQEQWMEWKGHHWEKCFPSKVEAAVELVAERYQETALHERSMAKQAIEMDDKEGQRFHNEAARKLTRAIDSLHKSSGLTSTLRFALAADEPLMVMADQLDVDPYLMGCSNGVIEMLTGTHRAGRPDDYITRVCPFPWTGLDTPCPLWEQTVFTILGENQEVYHFFHKIVGYALTGVLLEKLIIILLGEEGDSGKTTLFEILFDVLKGYAAPMPVELLLDQGIPQNPNSPTPAIMALRGQRLNWASEPGENRRFSVDRVKYMSGGDTLVGRYPWDKGPTSFTPTHTLFMLTNHKLKAPAHDQPFWSRVRLFNCPYSFKAHPNPDNPNERPRNEHLKSDILEHEGPGILAWVVRGLHAYMKEGLTPPTEIVTATLQYQREEDLACQFMDECLIASPGDKIQAADLYTVFKKWFTENVGRTPPSHTTFGKIMLKHVKKEKSGGIVYYYDVFYTAKAENSYAVGL